MGVLVTGGAGFIGSHMVLRLFDDGEDVFVVDNLSTGFRSAVPHPAKILWLSALRLRPFRLTAAPSS